MFRPLKAAVATLLLAAALATPVLARDLTEAEKAALSEAVDAFDAAMAAGDMAVVVKTVPDKMLQAIADQFGADKEQLLEQMIAQTEEAMKTVTITEYEMDMETAEYLETPDGTPYALIPSRTVIDMGTNGKIEANSKTLGLLDEGKWYLIRVDDQSQVQFLQKAYPSFVGVTFPASTMTPVTE